MLSSESEKSNPTHAVLTVGMSATTARLIPFVLIIIIAEEAIPLVVIYAPFLLPSTCLLPSQKERIDQKRREKQKEYTELYAPVFESVHSRALSEPNASVDKLLGRRALVPYTGCVVSPLIRS